MAKTTSNNEGKGAAEPMDAGAAETSNPEARTNRKRNVYAMDTLIAEVGALFPEAAFDVSNYDGRNAAHDISFTTTESEGLAELVALVSVDDRVAEVLSDESAVLVSFVTNARIQDSRAPFGLADAWDVLAEQGSL